MTHVPERPADIAVDRWRVRAALAPLLGEPRIASAMTSQLAAGHVVQVLEQRDAWCHVRGEDDYAGWMHEGYLTPASGDESSWRTALGASVREADGRVGTLPLGARIAPAATVLHGEVFEAATRAQRFPLEAHAIVRSATTLFVGAPYLWGAVTPWGCDCSGFVQAIMRLHGVSLPRDAWEQALQGRLVAFDELAPADLLFFSDREDQRITHVGLALDGARMVHSSLARAGVAVESWDSDDPYVIRLREQFVSARRLGAIGER